METIRIELHIPQPIEPEKKKSWLYNYFYELGKAYAKSNKPSDPYKIKPLFKTDWNRDYSDLDTPTVFRKEKRC
jgi:hypothetical protein